MSDEDLLLDKRQVRRAFERAAARYEGAAVLQHEVCRRMLERLSYIKIEPKAILDAGSGTGNAHDVLMSRHPRVPIVALDLAVGMLHEGRARRRWWQTLPGLRPELYAVCGDVEQLPLADEAVGLVWSNLTLQWVNDLPRVFRDLYRVLTPGGLLMFSTFGPDTLKELREAYRGMDRNTHVNRFVDMHDIGDMLVSARYARSRDGHGAVHVDLPRRAIAHARSQGDRRAQRDARPRGGTFREISTRRRHAQLREAAARRPAARDLRGRVWSRVEAASADEPDGAQGD